MRLAAEGRALCTVGGLWQSAKRLGVCVPSLIPTLALSAILVLSACHIDTRELDLLFVNLPIETTNPFSLSHCIYQKLVSLTFVMSESVLVRVLRKKYTDFK